MAYNIGTGTGTITYNPNDAGFSVVSPNASPLSNDPTVGYATTGGAVVKQTSSNSAINTNQVVTPRVFPAAGPAPAPPDTSNLTNLEQQVRRKALIAGAMKQYDELSAATEASGFQAANNAGNVYANRLLQSGVNPLASGVVAAQAKLPVYKQLADIGVQKEQTRLDASNKADALAAQIASTVGQLQMSYANMLADFNTKQTGYNLDLTKFDASLGQQKYEYQNDYRLKAAQVAAQQYAAYHNSGGTGGSGGGSAKPPGFFPGYIPNSGPIIGSSANPNQVQLAY